MDGKALLLSKTFWVNVVALAGMALQASGLVSGADWLGYEAGALGIINIILRLVTGQPITGVVKSGGE